MAGSRQVTRLEAERYVPDRLWYCSPSAAKPVIESKYKLRPSLADLHLVVGELKSAEMAYIYVWLESSYDPPEGHPGQLAYTFLICILWTFFISVSIFSVCCYSRVSISVGGEERGRGRKNFPVWHQIRDEFLQIFSLETGYYKLFWMKVKQEESTVKGSWSVATFKVNNFHLARQILWCKNHKKTERSKLSHLGTFNQFFFM